MNAATERLSVAGRAGPIEVARDRPDGQSRGTAIVCHPHPLFGGTMDNKVVQTLARAFVQSGWTVLRPNFRGVGQSAGAHDGGIAETDDLEDLTAAAAPDGDLALAGFSFGAWVVSRLVSRLHPARQIPSLVLVGTAASRFVVPPIPAALHPATLVIHGEADDTVELSSVLDWARPQTLPVTVVPGGGHFFHGQLPLLKSLVLRHLRAT